MLFQIETKVNYNDCDVNNLLKVSAAMRYMQQASSEHLEWLKIPTFRLQEESMVFLLSKMCIKVHQMPSAAQTILVGTAPTATKGARYLREFVIDSQEGERLVSALSIWMLVDPVSRKIIRPSHFPYEIPFQEPILEGIVGDITFPKPAEDCLMERTKIPVRYSHIDSNRHVNNSIYADFVCDLLPFEQFQKQKIDTLVVSYHSEARWGNTIDVSTYALPENEYYFAGEKENSACFEAYIILQDETLANCSK